MASSAAPCPATGCPPAPAAALPAVGRAALLRLQPPRVCPIRSSPCPRGDSCLCTSGTLLAGASSVQMRTGFYQARVPCRDQERDRTWNTHPRGSCRDPADRLCKQGQAGVTPRDLALVPKVGLPGPRQSPPEPSVCSWRDR